MVLQPRTSQNRGMTETPPQDRLDSERMSTANLRNYTELRRSVADRKVAGVAGGLGRHLNIDPTILRVIFVVLCFFGGAGFLLYGVAWLLVPEDGQSNGNISTSPSTRNTLLIVAAVLSAALVIGDSWGGFGFPWPLAIVAVVVFVVLMNRGTPVNTQAPGEPGAATVPTATDQEHSPPQWLPPAQYAYQPPAPQPDRGPKLFWITLAVVAIVLGCLGLYDSTGENVAAAAYPALALAVVGAMLVLGAWVGRAGGLILLGVLAAIALAITSVVDSDLNGERRIEVAPTSAAQLENSYYVPTGSIILDLSEIQDVESLDGREINLDANAGEIVVTLPPDTQVDVSADVSVVGGVVVAGEEANGANVHLDRSLPGDLNDPELDLDIHLLVGNIEVRNS